MRAAPLAALLMAVLAGCGGAAPGPSSATDPGATGGAPPPPGILDPSADGFLLSGVGHYRDPIGYLHIVGEAENRGATDRSLQVEVQLLDAAGADQGRTFTYACLPLVPAGGRSGFHAIVQDKDEAVASWVVTPVPGANGTARPLEVTGTPSTDALGHEHVQGTVVNPGSLAAAKAKVCATFLMEDGTVGDVAFAATTPSDVPPGATAAFEVRALRDAAPFADRHLAAQPTEA